jgi:hypothetical protein
MVPERVQKGTGKSSKCIGKILLLITASGYVPGGSGTTIHNTIHKKHKRHKITHTNSKQYTTQKLRTQCTKRNSSIKQYDKRNIHMYNYPNMI